jgi:hypothetical protein
MECVARLPARPGLGVRTGLLWFDDSPKVPLAAKVDHAVRRYREKFGKAPNVCCVHPRTLADAGTDAVPVRLVELANIQPNCFWVGLA